MNQIEHTHEDEIELIDILKVIWKWKYTIISGTIVCGFIAGIISYTGWKNKPKMYITTTILEPRSSYINSKGKREYDFSVEYLKFLVDELIEYRALKDDEAYSDNISETPLGIQASIPKKLDVVRISCESKKPETGVSMLKKLLKKLSEKIQENMVILNGDEIAKKKRILENNKVETEKYKKQIRIINDRINELRSNITVIENNKKNIIKQKERVLSQKSVREKTISSLLISSTIEQNIDLESRYKNDIYMCLLEKENIEFDLNAKLNEVKGLESEIAALGFNQFDSQSFSDMDGKIESTEHYAGSVHVVSPPTPKPLPRKNKTKISAMIGSAIGLFIMIFIIFFIEYIKKNIHNR